MEGSSTDLLVQIVVERFTASRSIVGQPTSRYIGTLSHVIYPGSYPVGTFIVVAGNRVCCLGIFRLLKVSPH